MAGRLFTLQDYIEHKGAAEVAREVGVDDVAVHYWKTFQRAPRPHTAHKLIQITNGLLTWEGIYQPFVDQHNEMQLTMDFSKSASK